MKTGLVVTPRAVVLASTWSGNQSDRCSDGIAAAAVVLVLTMFCTASWALETDQYWAWGRPLGDSTAAVNVRMNIELERAISSLPARGAGSSCTQVSVAFRKRLRFILLHEIQLWAWSSETVSRVPEGEEERCEYRRTNLYSNHPFIDPGVWMPFAPTIEVDGVRFGTDKLAHLVSSGWRYYSEYRDALERGASAEEAERQAVRRGMLEESLVLGGLTSGVQSIADIEASFAGLRLFRDLCGGDEPILELEAGAWVIARRLDLREYVTPGWDESFQPPVFSRSRWRRVRPILEGYCERLDDSGVVAMRRRYRQRHRSSPVSEVLAELVVQGRLPDPAQFGIEAVCGRVDSSWQGPSPAADPTARVSGREDATVVERILAEERDRRRRVLGLLGAQLGYPQLLSASVGGMVTSQPSSFECRVPCVFRGPFAELEPGLGGAKLSVGWGRVTGTTSRSGTWLNRAYIGLLYKATVLRTWGSDSLPLEPGRTYAGLELGVPVAQVGLGLGLLYRVDGDDDETGRWLVTGGVGWGF